MANANSARRNALTRDDSGFTLIELLITIVIMAVIAAISIPSIAQAAIAQRDDASQAAAKEIALAESSVFSLQRSYVDLPSLQARKLANGIVNSTVLLGPNSTCYTAVAVSKNGVAFIAESGLASVKLTPNVTSSCAAETDLQGAVVSLGGSVSGRTAVSSVSPVASVIYTGGNLTWPAVTGATYLVERLDGTSWTSVQQSAALTFAAPVPAAGVSVRYQVTAQIGTNSSTAKQFLLTSDAPNNLITSGDLSRSAFGWILTAGGSGAYYSNMTAGVPGYIALGINSIATDVITIPASSPTLHLVGVFSSTAGINVQFDFFVAGANTSTDTPISTSYWTGSMVVAGIPVSPPATAALIKITVTDSSATASQFQSLTLQ